jgi:threonine dehydrogenase-like Zn-dependent dehydrogenase
MRPLLAHIEAGRLDPTFVITHRLSLDEAPQGFDTFKHKEDDCVKVVLTPGAPPQPGASASDRRP